MVDIYKNIEDYNPIVKEFFFLCAKDTFKAIYQFLINKRESTDLKHLNHSKMFIDYSNNMDNIYKKS